MPTISESKKGKIKIAVNYSTKGVRPSQPYLAVAESGSWSKIRKLIPTFLPSHAAAVL